MLTEKTILYDWYGLNESLFKTINSFHNDSYDMVMILISRMADHHNFPYYLCALAVWVAGSFIVRKIRSKGGSNQYLAMWFGAFMVLIAGYAADGVITKTLKEEFSYPRPYVALGPQDVHVLDYIGDSSDDHHSFPSGHAVFITLMVIGLWPVLPQSLRWVGVFLIPLVCWSRIAMGMHFPADVLSGFLLSLFITIIVRTIIYRILLAIHIKC